MKLTILGNSSPFPGINSACSGYDDPVRGKFTHAHLTPELAAQMAKDAGVKRLLLTHFWPYTLASELVDKAKTIFMNVEASKVGVTYEI